MARADFTPSQTRPTPRQAALVRGTVKAHIQEDRQWFMTVELRGGRLLRKVAPLEAVSGLISGSRSALPPIQAKVLIGFAEPEDGVDAFVLGCYDGYAQGLDHDDAQESVSLTAAGLGHAVSPDGTMTTMFPGGDELTAGPGAGYDFQLRDSEGQLFKPKFPQRALRILLDARKGGLLLGARLLGGVEVLADATRRRILLKVTEKDQLEIKPGLIRAQTGSMVVGERDYMTAAVARWPETSATLDALKKELQQVKHRTVLLEAHRIKHDLQLQLLVSEISPLFYLQLPLNLILPVPLPFITPQGKDGALIPVVGGVEVVDAGARTLHAE